eukprot:s975_g41.t1
MVEVACEDHLEKPEKQHLDQQKHRLRHVFARTKMPKPSQRSTGPLLLPRVTPRSTWDELEKAHLLIGNLRAGRQDRQHQAQVVPCHTTSAWHLDHALKLWLWTWPERPLQVRACSSKKMASSSKPSVEALASHVPHVEKEQKGPSPPHRQWVGQLWLWIWPLLWPFVLVPLVAELPQDHAVELEGQEDFHGQMRKKKFLALHGARQRLGPAPQVELGVWPSRDEATCAQAPRENSCADCKPWCHRSHGVAPDPKFRWLSMRTLWWPFQMALYENYWGDVPLRRCPMSHCEVASRALEWFFFFLTLRSPPNPEKLDHFLLWCRARSTGETCHFVFSLIF